MGYLMKEALKSLCGVNQWSYAVLWKIGCQNPKLLIWEECYYEPMPCSVLSGDPRLQSQELVIDALEGCWVPPDACNFQIRAQTGQRLHMLINKMMMDYQVHVLGEGLVGRAAFSGNYQWIVYPNYNEGPPEVLNEVRLQFSAGMQTIAVIPVIPHGVVQFGSSLAIMENIGFVHEVNNIIHQLSCVSSTLLSDDRIKEQSVERMALPVAPSRSVSGDTYGNSKQTVTGSLFSIDSNMQRSLIPPLELGTSLPKASFSQLQDATTSTCQNLQITQSSKSLGDHCQSKFSQQMDQTVANKGSPENEVNGAGGVLLRSDVLLDQHTSYNYCQSAQQYRSSKFDEGLPERMDSNESSCDLNTFITSQLNTNKGRPQNSSGINCVDTSSGRSKLVEDISYLLGGYSHRSVDPSITLAQMGDAAYQDPDSSGKKLVQLSDTAVWSAGHSLLSGGYNRPQSTSVRQTTEFFQRKGERADLCEVVSVAALDIEDDMPSCKLASGVSNDFCDAKQLPLSDNLFEMKSSRGDDLFDVLGVHLKNKLLSGGGSKFCNSVGADSENQIEDICRSMNLQDFRSDPYISESGVFTKPSSDDLLDAVVSGTCAGVKQHADDDMSCRTTLKKIRNSSVPSVFPTNGLVVAEQMQEDPLGFSNRVGRLDETEANCVSSACGNMDVRNCSQTSSACGSQLSSWIEQGSIVKRDTSISTANSKKVDEGCRSNRRRLKHCENPRPRPKDRQMIQDRMKELREIVPNGEKCSIDALLDRTIKHMLFLQSVTKHADKLKQMVESKIINEDGGLLLKDNYEGGATWAYEVGSNSTVCPIVVEDLNPPRQLLVEMLCEERGFFLEIADMIRGLGLTILKGVMETRNNKIWARFAVEADRDVTRMEIFIPLVRLLEQTVKSNGASTSDLNEDNIGAKAVFHQASPILGKQSLVGPIACSEPPRV